ncbi:MAG: hypothetical protein ACKN9T_06215 [Candidatus Methylumidiphilus sp.]
MSANRIASMLLAAGPMLAGCAGLAPADGDPPLAFHDTRLQYALASGDNATLAQDFNMKLPPSWAERIVAGGVLPFTAVTETAFYPVAAGIAAFAPSQQQVGGLAQ